MKESLDHVVRFPRFVGQTNILPVNLAADEIVRLVESNARGIHFITNPSPPSSEWLALTNFECLGVHRRIAFVDCSLSEYEGLDLSDSERRLYDYLRQFVPYWTGPHVFPDSRVRSACIDTGYIGEVIDHARSKDWI